jgi:hypothetical protein
MLLRPRSSRTGRESQSSYYRAALFFDFPSFTHRGEETAAQTVLPAPYLVLVVRFLLTVGIAPAGEGISRSDR